MTEKMTLRDDDLDLVAILSFLWRKRKLILGLALSAALATAAHQWLIATPVYRSECSLLSAGGGRGNTILQMENVAGFLGLPRDESGDLLSLFCSSRSLGERIAQKLEPGIDAGTRVFAQASGNVFRALKVEQSRTGRNLTLAWEDSNPDFARKRLQIVLEELRLLYADHAAGKKRLHLKFIEDRMASARTELVKTEEALLRFQERHRGFEIQKQAEGMVALLNDLTSRREQEKVELNVQKGFVTENDPNVRRLSFTVDELQRKIDEITGSGNVESPSPQGFDFSLTAFPGIGLEAARLIRETALKRKIVDLLAEQQEMARIEANKDPDSFDVLDEPSRPWNPVRPRKLWNTALAGLGGLVAGVAFVLFLWASEERRRRLPADSSPTT